jgi:gag-polypeptide of LTR copia-type
VATLNFQDLTVSSSKFAYKQCPPFDPTFYRPWPADVKLAFAERDWSAYLVPPDEDEDKFIPDPKIALKPGAFLSQAIPFQHKVGMEHCETAAELFSSLEQQYGSTSRGDELRLETELIHMRKTGSVSVEDHIAEFKSKMAAIMDQRDLSSKHKTDKRNHLFLAMLEYSDIEDEKWEMSIPFLGNTWRNMTPEALLSATLSYYYAHIAPKKSGERSTSVEATVYRTQGKLNWHGCCGIR